MDYQGIIDNLKIESVIELMQKLGADRYKDEGTHIIFPTICHNEAADEASMKLYFYKNTKLQKKLCNNLLHNYNSCVNLHFG